MRDRERECCLEAQERISAQEKSQQINCACRMAKLFSCIQIPHSPRNIGVGYTQTSDEHENTCKGFNKEIIEKRDKNFVKQCEWLKLWRKTNKRSKEDTATNYKRWNSQFLSFIVTVKFIAEVTSTMTQFLSN